ncbi:MAG TPA: LysR family transcriptional regulator [Symbiobacteriaceae bacterium]|nr:LysR family transcriptional regulator [Symbiobacteriaceae bacterium]
MELRQLQTFCVVAEVLSFTRAAEQLNYSQSTVTGQIQALEAELGTPLFDRLGRRVALTEAGHRLLRLASRILSLVEKVPLSVPGECEPAGTLLIGTPESVGTYRLPRILKHYYSRFPKVQLQFRTGTCASLRRAVAEGALDMAFLLEGPVEPLPLVVDELVAEPLVLVTHPEHPLGELPGVKPEDLEGEPLLLTEPGSYRRLFERALALAGVRMGAIQEFAGIESLKQCVMSGIGIGFLPEMAVAGEIAQGRMIMLPWAGTSFEVVTQMCWHKDKHMSAALRALIEQARECLGNG